jgi:hypothetical protein
MQLIESSRGEWFIDIDGALFLIRADGTIGSDDAANASFQALLKAIVR